MPAETKPLPHWVDPSMALPPGKTCGDCQSFIGCKGLFGCKPENRWCDWAPSRFSEKQVAKTSHQAANESPL